MMSSTRCMILFICLSLFELIISNIEGKTLFELNHRMGWPSGRNPLNITYIDCELFLNNDPYNPSSATGKSIYWQRITPADVGSYFWADTSSLGFKSVVETLTDGNNSCLWTFGYTFPGKSGQGKMNWESGYFGESIDLQGNIIEEIGLRLDFFNLTSTMCDVGVTYVVCGESIPEPTTMLLLGLGGLLIRRKK